MLHKTWVFDPRTAGLVLQIRLCCMVRDHIPELCRYFKYYTMILGRGGKCNIFLYLRFMGPCIANIFQNKANKMQLLHGLFIPGNYSTYFGCYFHPLSRAQTTVSTASGIYHTVTGTCHYRGRGGTAGSSNSSTIAADNSKGVTNTRCCRYSCLCS